MDGRSIALDLPAGRHEFKFVVDGVWEHSPELETFTDDNGNVNNVLRVGKTPGQQGGVHSTGNATEVALDLNQAQVAADVADESRRAHLDQNVPKSGMSAPSLVAMEVADAAQMAHIDRFEVSPPKGEDQEVARVAADVADQARRAHLDNPSATAPMSKRSTVASEVADAAEVAKIEKGSTTKADQENSQMAQVASDVADQARRAHLDNPSRGACMSAAAETSNEVANAAREANLDPSRAVTPNLETRRVAQVAADVADEARRAHVDTGTNRSPMSAPAQAAIEVADAAEEASLDQSPATSPPHISSTSTPRITVDKVIQPQPSHGEVGSSNADAIDQRRADAIPDEVTYRNDPIPAKGSSPNIIPRNTISTVFGWLWQFVVHRVLGRFAGFFVSMVGLKGTDPRVNNS